MTTLRILHILNELRPSGAEIMLRLAAPHWIAMGFKLDIWSTSVQIGSYAQQLKDAGYTVYHSPISTRYKLKIQDVNKDLRDRFQDYDIIHIHTDLHALKVANLLSSLKNTTLVRTVHNNFDFVGISRSYIRRILDRYLCRKKCVNHISISPSVQKNEMTRFINTSSLILNWVDTDHYRPPNRSERNEARLNVGVSPEKILMVSVGNGSSQKNYHAIIEAIGMMKSCQIVYFQVGNERKDGLDRKTALKCNVEEQVVFMGPTSDPRKLLWAADVFIMPSLFEGFGLAAAEAMLTGIPCIFSDVIGLSDWKNFKQPILWTGTDPFSIQKVITGFTHNRPEFISGEYLEDMKQKLSPKRGSDEYANIYQTCIRNNKRI